MEGCWGLYQDKGCIIIIGCSQGLFPLYLKEIEFRLSNRDKGLFNELVNILLRR
jgi:hypothetical protein